MTNIAHRGASGYAPENTFAAFDLGVSMKADALETDIRLSRDGVMVMHHDGTLDRTTDGAGPLAELTFEQLQRLDAGARHSPQFAGQRIPRLDETLDRYLPVIAICLEIKDPLAVPPLLALLAAKGLGQSDRLEVNSFDWDAVMAVHAAMPRLRTAFLTKQFGEPAIAQVGSAGLGQICTPNRNLTPELIDFARARGVAVRAGGCKTLEDLARAKRIGADSALCNYPDWMKAVSTGAS